MKWLKRVIRIIAREEIEAMLNDSHYVNMVKMSIRRDIHQQTMNENEEYLKSMRD